jgi:hypothetical protein
VKKHLGRNALGLLIVLSFIGHAAYWYRIPIVDNLEAIIYDVRLRLTMPRGVDPRIVIVDIDEKSLKEEGRWPWRRDRLGLFLDKLLDQYKAKVVGFDIVFAEKDESSGLRVLEAIGQNELKDNAPFQSALKTVTPKLQFDRLFADRWSLAITSRTKNGPAGNCRLQCLKRVSFRGVTSTSGTTPASARTCLTCSKPPRPPATSILNPMSTASCAGFLCWPSTTASITNRSL